MRNPCAGERKRSIQSLRRPVIGELRSGISGLAATNGFSAVTSVDVEITRRCNLKCLMCGRKESIYAAEMPDADFQRVCEMLGGLPWVRSVHLVGLGEPTLHKSFARYADMLSLLGKQLIVTTNGSFLNRSLDALRHFDCVNISLNAATEATHDTVMPGVPLQVVLEGIRRLVHAKKQNSSAQEIRGLFIASRSNVHDIEPFFRLAQELNLASVYFENTNGPWYEDDVYQLMLSMIERGRHWFRGDVHVMQRQRENAVPPLHCEYVKSFLRIGVDSILRVCPYVDEKYGKSLSGMGTLTACRSARHRILEHLFEGGWPQCATCNQTLG